MMKSNTKLRRGITITEALASIGVAAVGLFGVLAVIPFAARQAEVGLDLDFAVAAGKNGFHDFEARGMGDRGVWRIGYAETAGVPAADFNPNAFTNVNLTPADRLETVWGNRVIVIDPLFLKVNEDLLDSEFAIDHFPLGNFDVGDMDPDDLNDMKTSQTAMRVNVAAKTRFRNDIFQATNVLTDDPLAYNFAQAVNVFQHQDDLSFGESEDNLLLPPQNYKLINPAQSNQDVTNRMKRSSSGKISWMAMMVPENGNPFLYRAYIVVFKKRQLRFKRISSTDNLGNITQQIAGERIYDALPAAGNQGIGGGEFDLTLTSGTFAENKSPRAGDWILLTDNDENYRWYRISRTNSDNAPDQLQVSLTGPNWNTTLTNTQAIALSGVIAVYEKTIPIENNSIWYQ
jgi:hypothetical protein